MRRGVTPFLGEPFRPGELAANRCRPGQFRQQLAFPDRGCWIAGDNSPCVELTRTAQAPRAAFLFARLSSGPRPCRWCGRTRPESLRTQPESCCCQQPFQRCEPLPVQLLRPAAPLASFPKLGLAVGLGPGDTTNAGHLSGGHRPLGHASRLHPTVVNRTLMRSLRQGAKLLSLGFNFGSTSDEEPNGGLACNHYKAQKRTIEDLVMISPPCWFTTTGNISPGSKNL